MSNTRLPEPPFYVAIVVTWEPDERRGEQGSLYRRYIMEKELKTLLDKLRLVRYIVEDIGGYVVSISIVRIEEPKPLPRHEDPL